MVLSDSKPSETQSPLSPIQWVHAYWVSRCIYVVAKLGIADLLKDGSQHCDALAAATNTHSNSLYRVLRALAGIGIFAQTQPGCFELTPLANCLQSNVPDSIRDIAILRGEEHYYNSWGNLMYSLQTGETAFQHLYGMNLFEYNERNSVEGEIFHQAVASSKEAYAAFLVAYDFSSIGKLVDVGGGTGSFLTAILEANSTMTGVLFELPEVIDQAKNSQRTASVNDRCQLIGGSFFEAIPERGDAYLLMQVIHNWDDERAIAILKCCHQAMKEQARLLVIDSVIPSGNEFFGAKFMDVNMLIMCPGGRERTEAQFRDLFASAGFELTTIIRTKSELSIIEGVKTVNS
ncbi:methyltransferase (plasmid) [Nostoc sp. UHCC 0926]|uniref:methyltransferase n=1 Tax=Nostoc sp. UHCC 0926 TaxID=3025190 RepID=UPI00236116A8|nr:methyltransferase [Nostoc sp. UHCC 0926]WDD36965.1 methyltransferase [Nostoc sp. UHCC 0926]